MRPSTNYMHPPALRKRNTRSSYETDRNEQHPWRSEIDYIFWISAAMQKPTEDGRFYDGVLTSGDLCAMCIDGSKRNPYYTWAKRHYGHYYKLCWKSHWWIQLYNYLQTLINEMWEKLIIKFCGDKNKGSILQNLSSCRVTFFCFLNPPWYSFVEYILPFQYIRFSFFVYHIYKLVTTEELL